MKKQNYNIKLSDSALDKKVKTRSIPTSTIANHPVLTYIKK